MMGLSEEAISSYEKCLWHRETHSYCRLNLAATQETLGHDPTEQLEKCIGLEANTRNEARGQKLCIFNLGRHFANRGNGSKAIEILESLVNEENNDSWRMRLPYLIPLYLIWVSELMLAQTSKQ